MTERNLTLTHVDTCLSCYVSDHCNGMDEMLIGVPVDGNTAAMEVRDGVESEIAQSDKLPDDITSGMIAEALDSEFPANNTGAPFDSTLGEPDPEDDSGESVYAWFRLTWDVTQAEEDAHAAELAGYARAARYREDVRAAEFAAWIAGGATMAEAQRASVRAADRWRDVASVELARRIIRAWDDCDAAAQAWRGFDSWCVAIRDAAQFATLPGMDAGTLAAVAPHLTARMAAFRAMVTWDDGNATADTIDALAQSVGRSVCGGIAALRAEVV